MSPKKRKLISIIVPVLNEGENIRLFYNALTKEIDKISDIYDFEIIFTDNHSDDETFYLLKQLNAEDCRVKAYRFSRNYGYQRSILMGYKKAKGAAVIQIDCDLQDSPSLILEFINLWNGGKYKVVYGVRRTRKENVFINTIRKVFYRLINLLSEDKLPVNAGDFRLVDRKIVDILRNNKDAHPYLRGSIASMGFDQIGIEYDRDERLYGESKFKFLSLFSMAIDGILNHSIIPLRISSITGLLVVFLTIVGVIMYLIEGLFFGENWPPGFATIVILLLLGLAMNALFLGIIGEYVGRLYKQSKQTDVIIENSIE